MSSLTRELANIGDLPADVTLLIAESDAGAYAALRTASRDMREMLPSVENYMSKRTVRTVNDRGVVEYKYNGVLNRIDGPAVIYPNGAEWWFRMGYIHRDGDLPAITSPGGRMVYCKNGLRHRDNGPAEISTYEQAWYTYNLRNRKERDAQGRLLPAIVYIDNGQGRYFIDDVEVDELGHRLSI